MILVDTSVWVDHLRAGDAGLAALLEQNLVVMQPLIIGELACGNLHNRMEILTLLGSLPSLPEASHEEVLHLIEQYQLMGRGIGYIDIHLLASVLLEPAARLWTRDKRLCQVVENIGLGY